MSDLYTLGRAMREAQREHRRRSGSDPGWRAKMYAAEAAFDKALNERSEEPPAVTIDAKALDEAHKAIIRESPCMCGDELEIGIRAYLTALSAPPSEPPAAPATPDKVKRLVKSLRDYAYHSPDSVNILSAATALEAYAARVAELERECFALAATQCDAPRVSEYGLFVCDWRARAEAMEKLERAAATHVESLICLRSKHFTGEPPYVGWKGLGLALEQDYDRAEAMERALRRIAEGDVPRTRAVPWRETPTKHDKCPHDKAMWEDCDQCTADFARAALPVQAQEQP